MATKGKEKRRDSKDSDDIEQYAITKPKIKSGTYNNILHIIFIL